MFATSPNAGAAGTLSQPDAGSSTPTPYEVTLPSGPTSPCEGSTYYVALDGSDDNPGSYAEPFATIQKAVDSTEPGDTVRIRAGRYHETVSITNSGTTLCPITIAGYFDERPVIDGEYVLPTGEDARCDPETGNCFNYEALVSVEGSYVILQGLEVQRSRGRGVRVWPNDHNIVSDCWVHDNHNVGILIQDSTDTLVEGCRVWHSADYAPYPRPAQELDWSGGIALRRANHTVIRGNTVYNNWGEGIIPVSSRYVTIEDNVVYDNLAVNIYADYVGDIRIQRNLVYSTNTPPFLREGNPPPGIVFATEPKEFEQDSQNQTVINNIVVGNGHNIAWWGTGRNGALVNAVIAHNTLVNAAANDGEAVNLSIGDSPSHANVRVEGNIIVQNTPGAIADVPDDPAFTFRNNLWSVRPPRRASGPGDIVADPELANPDALLVPGAVEPDWYKIRSSSPAVGASRSQPEVTEDFFGNPRTVHPDIGAHEIPGASNEPRVVHRVDRGCGLPVVGGTLALVGELGWCRARKKEGRRS
jgi:parallel beta-helix repeat protein